MCRNVLIYFDRDLQENVFKLFDESLRNYGFLCLGTKENLEHSNIMEKFVRYNKEQKVYQKRGNINV